MATSSLSEKVSRLTAQIEKYDQQISRATEGRDQAISEIQNLLSGNTAGFKTSAPTTKPAGKLGDRILTVLNPTTGFTREFIADKLRTPSQKVSLALYHLKTKQLAFESGGQWFKYPQPEVSNTSSALLTE